MEFVEPTGIRRVTQRARLVPWVCQAEHSLKQLLLALSVLLLANGTVAQTPVQADSDSALPVAATLADVHLHAGMTTRRAAVVFESLDVPAIATRASALAPVAAKPMRGVAGQLNLKRFNLGGTELIGWRTGERWYFGRHRADESSVGFVWRADETQSVTLGHKGVSYFRRF